jgi:hypothetical protein
MSRPPGQGTGTAQKVGSAMDGGQVDRLAGTPCFTCLVILPVARGHVCTAAVWLHCTSSASSAESGLHCIASIRLFEFRKLIIVHNYVSKKSIIFENFFAK